MITIYTGPMKSGKTTKLIEKYKEKQLNGRRCIMLKPIIDTRSDKVISRNNLSVYCEQIKRIEEIYRYSYIYDTFFIDEFQFLSGSVDLLRDMSDNGCNIYVSSLNLNSNKETFGSIGNLMCIADNIEILKSNCDICGQQNAGKYTFCCVPKQEEILIGDTEYKSVCPKCYKELINKGTI